MKNKIIIGLIVVGVIGAYFFVTNKNLDSGSKDQVIEITNQPDLASPSRPAEINGIVKSVEGNIIVIANEINKEQLSEEDRDTRKEEMQNLSQEERQASRQQDLETIETQDLEIIIPVGVTISKGSGNNSGDNVATEISDITKDIYLSIWVTENNTPEFVKIKGIGQ